MRTFREHVILKEAGLLEGETGRILREGIFDSLFGRKGVNPSQQTQQMPAQQPRQEPETINTLIKKTDWDWEKAAMYAILHSENGRNFTSRGLEGKLKELIEYVKRNGVNSLYGLHSHPLGEIFRLTGTSAQEIANILNGAPFRGHTRSNAEIEDRFGYNASRERF